MTGKDTLIPQGVDSRPQPHPLSHLGDRSLRDRTGFARAFAEDFLDAFRVRLQLLFPLTDRLQVGNEVIGQGPLSINTAERRRRAPRAYPLNAFGVRERRGQGVIAADGRASRVLTRHTRAASC